jgi:DNA-binding GntR family transcriptional regulator
MKRSRVLLRVDRAPLHERIYTQLRTAIMCGHFSPGEALTIRALAEEFGTSVMPVRDALTRLIADGAVEMPTSRAFRIPLLTRRGFIDLCRVRLLLEGYAAAQGCRLMTSDALRQVLEADRQITIHFRAAQYTEALDANAQMLFTIYSASRQQVLLSHIESLWMQSGPYLILRMRQMAEDPEQHKQPSIGHHQELLQALRQRDSRETAAAIRRDIRLTMKIKLPDQVASDAPSQRRSALRGR